MPNIYNKMDNSEKKNTELLEIFEKKNKFIMTEGSVNQQIPEVGVGRG